MGSKSLEIADPRLKLVLFENPGATSALNYLGVEVASTDDVRNPPVPRPRALQAATAGNSKA